MQSLLKDNVSVDKSGSPSMATTSDHQKTPLFLALLLLILLTAGGVYLIQAINQPTFLKAESCNAQTAREMLAAGDLLSPIFHGKLFLDKPILNYWLIVAGFKALGVSLVSARIPSILVALTCIATIGISMRMLFGWQAGLLAAMALANSIGFADGACACMPDMLLALFDIFTLTLLYAAAINEKRRQPLFLLAAASSAMAFLTKGPVGLVLPSISFLCFLLVTRQLFVLKPRYILLGALTFLVLAAPWYVYITAVHGPGALHWLLLKENLQRFLGSVDVYNFGHRPWYMAETLVTGFAPWSVFLVPIMVSAWKRRSHFSQWTGLLLYLGLWIGISTAFFTLSRSNWGYYSLPVYPAEACIVGICLATWIKEKNPLATWSGWSIVLALFAGSLISAYFLQQTAGMQRPDQYLTIPVILAFCGSLAFACMRFRKLFAAYATLFIAISLVMVSYCMQILPLKVADDPAVVYAKIVKTLPANAVLSIHSDFLGQYLLTDLITFVSGRELLFCSSQDLAAYFRSPLPVFALISEGQLRQLPSDATERVRVIERRPFSWLDFSGCRLSLEVPSGHKLPLLLVTNQK